MLRPIEVIESRAYSDTVLEPRTPGKKSEKMTRISTLSIIGKTAPSD